MERMYKDLATLKMTEGITSFNLCTFMVGLEGWRRGLTLTYYGDINEYSDIKTQGKKIIGRSYSFSSGDKTHYFNQSRGDKVSNEAVKIAQSKQKTKDYLIKSNVPTIPSIEFKGSNTDEDIISESRSIGFPMIVKPTYGSLSKGVILNIQNESELYKALRHVRGKLKYKSVIVERYFEGDDIRLYVVDGVVVAGLRREPAKVTGTGVDTIRSLINKINKSREHNPYLKTRPIKIDQEVYGVLDQNNYKLEDILEKDKTILVKKKSTMNQGVDLYDITDEIQDYIKQMGVDALKSLPNIIHGSIDLLYDGKDAVVLEVNPSANISMHMFPTEGQPRNIGAFLMDLYFPETKNQSTEHSNMYFDFLPIVEMLKNNYINFIEIKSLAENEIKAEKYLVGGKIQKTGYRNWVKRQAIKLDIHGHAKVLYDGDIEVIAASENEEKLNKFKVLCKKGPTKAKVEKLKSYIFDEEVKLGFELI